MRTVKELSDITGISVRTLHYYDEIGLLKPTATSGIKKKRDFMFAYADFYRKEPLLSKLDGEYGEGTAAFFAGAIESFYRK